MLILKTLCAALRQYYEESPQALVQNTSFSFLLQGRAKFAINDFNSIPKVEISIPELDIAVSTTY